MGKSDRPLHPNLAKLAATYDSIVEDWVNKKIPTKTARDQISELSARDDNGINWHIDVDTAEWFYIGHDGRKIKTTPPSFGFASPTPYEVSRKPGVIVNKDTVVDKLETEHRPTLWLYEDSSQEVYEVKKHRSQERVRWGMGSLTYYLVAAAASIALLIIIIERH